MELSEQKQMMNAGFINDSPAEKTFDDPAFLSFPDSTKSFTLDLSFSIGQNPEADRSSCKIIDLHSPTSVDDGCNAILIKSPPLGTPYPIKESRKVMLPLYISSFSGEL